MADSMARQVRPKPNPGVGKHRRKGAYSSAARACKVCSGAADIRYTFQSVDGPINLHQCAECGFHFIDAFDPEEALDLPELDAGEVSAGLESNRQRISANFRFLLRHKSAGRLLDIGSGGGGFLLRAESRFEAVGVEVDPRYRAFARGKGLSVVANPSEVAGPFDAITMWDVLEHVNDPADTVAMALELLAPGGVLLLETPNRGGLLYRLGEVMARLSGGKLGGTMAMQYSPVAYCHKQIFREADLRRLLSGFATVTVDRRTELSFPAEFYLRGLIASKLARQTMARAIGAILHLIPLRNKLIVAAVKAPSFPIQNAGKGLP